MRGRRSMRGYRRRAGEAEIMDHGVAWWEARAASEPPASDGSGGGRARERHDSGMGAGRVGGLGGLGRSMEGVVLCWRERG